ncbi:MAG: hypothetical protein J3K34DRAFT_274919 [Monoraphidium minutum]|nr:MAG: hypothetical protein J3K34DRAFT_274919 [Monoraphidium minutum]
MYSEYGSLPKRDDDGRTVYEADSRGIVFLPPVTASSTTRLALPAGKTVIFSAFAKDTLDHLLFNGAAPSFDSARSKMLGPLTTPCAERAAVLRVDGIEIPNAGAAPDVVTDVEVVIPYAVMDSIMQRRGAKPLKMPKETEGGYRATIDMAGFFFLLPGGFGEGEHTLEFGLRSTCTVTGDTIEQGTRVNGDGVTVCYPDPDDCGAAEVVARTVTLPAFRATFDMVFTRG